MQIDKDLNDAEFLIKNGNRAEGLKILLSISDDITEPKLASDIVSLLVEAQAFSEATSFSHKFNEKYGKRFIPDYNLKEIQKIKLKKTIMSRPYPIYLKRMNWKERPGPANLINLFPIRELIIDQEYLECRTWAFKRKGSWKQVENPHVTQKRMERRPGWFNLRVLKFYLCGKQFRIDCSDRYSDFKESDLILEEFHKKTAIPWPPKL